MRRPSKSPKAGCDADSSLNASQRGNNVHLPAFFSVPDDVADPKRRASCLTLGTTAFRRVPRTIIARCSADPTTPNADRCDFLNIEDDLTWIFSTTVKPALDTGPTARVPCQD